MNPYSKLSGIVMLIIGIILLVWPGTTLVAFCRLLGWCLVVSGAVEVFLGITSDESVYATGGGAISLIVGIIFIVRPGMIISFLPFAIGVVVTVCGALILVRALIRREHGSAAAMTIAGSVVAVIAGLALILHPFTTVKLLMIVLGILLVYFGILRIGRS